LLLLRTYLEFLISAARWKFHKYAKAFEGRKQKALDGINLTWDTGNEDEEDDNCRTALHKFDLFALLDKRNFHGNGKS